MQRTLSLRKDVLTELTPDELTAVAGGTPTVQNLCRPLSLDDVCTRPTCGPGCTGVSDPVKRG